MLRHAKTWCSAVTHPAAGGMLRGRREAASQCLSMQGPEATRHNGASAARGCTACPLMAPAASAPARAPTGRSKPVAAPPDPAGHARYARNWPSQHAMPPWSTGSGGACGGRMRRPAHRLLARAVAARTASSRTARPTTRHALLGTPSASRSSAGRAGRGSADTSKQPCCACGARAARAPMLKKMREWPAPARCGLRCRASTTATTACPAPGAPPPRASPARPDQAAGPAEAATAAPAGSERRGTPTAQCQAGS